MCSVPGKGRKRCSLQSKVTVMGPERCPRPGRGVGSKVATLSTGIPSFVCCSLRTEKKKHPLKINLYFFYSEEVVLGIDELELSILGLREFTHFFFKYGLVFVCLFVWLVGWFGLFCFRLA